MSAETVTVFEDERGKLVRTDDGWSAEIEGLEYLIPPVFDPVTWLCAALERAVGERDATVDGVFLDAANRILGTAPAPAPDAVLADAVRKAREEPDGEPIHPEAWMEQQDRKERAPPAPAEAQLEAVRDWCRERALAVQERWGTGEYAHGLETAYHACADELEERRALRPAAAADTARLVDALEDIAAFDGKCLIGDGRYDEGAARAFSEAASIARVALGCAQEGEGT